MWSIFGLKGLVVFIYFGIIFWGGGKGEANDLI